MIAGLAGGSTWSAHSVAPEYVPKVALVAQLERSPDPLRSTYWPNVSTLMALVEPRVVRTEKNVLVL